MKLLVTALFALGSLSAYSAADNSTHNLSYASAHNFEYFHGSGVFKTPAGKSATFLASLTVRKLEEGRFNFIFGYFHSNKNIHVEIVLQNREGASFFDIKGKDDAVIGYGYCLGMKCHLEYGMAGRHMEQTMYRHKGSGSLYFMGSKTNAEGIIKSYRMSLKKIF